jgi:ATP-dependent Clp protease protease subunit
VAWKFYNKAPEETELRIDGDIVDDGDVWFYEWLKEPHSAPNKFRAELDKVKGKKLTVWVNSPGGSVFAAAGMYNALRSHKGGVTVNIDGEAMSAATVVAMAGDTINVSPVSVMMIHNPLVGYNSGGDAAELRQLAGVLDEVKESILNAYVIKTGRSRNDISALMDAETYMSAATAIEEGFADGYVDFGDDKPAPAPVAMKFARSIVNRADEEALTRFRDKLAAENAAAEKQKTETARAKARLKLAMEVKP